MKKSLLLLIFLTINFNSINLAQWVWKNPIPQGNPINSIIFINESTGFCVGSGGLILKSTNAGDSWQTKNCGYTKNLYKICYADISTLFAVGDNGLLLKSTDVGENWEKISINTNTRLRTIYFINANIGWIAGDNGVIFKTTNKGETWTDISGSFINGIYSITFINENVGYAASSGIFSGESKGVILKTLDGGINWQIIKLDNTNMINDIKMFNANQGYAVGSGFGIYSTTDGGSTWINKFNSDGKMWVYNFTTTPNGIILIPGYNYGTHKNFLLISSDQGNTWNTKIFSEEVHFVNRDIFAWDENTIICTGEGGRITKSKDLGESWTSCTEQKVKLNNIAWTSVKYLSDNEIIAVGGGFNTYSSSMTIIKSLDKGETWRLVKNIDGDYLGSIAFVDSKNGWAVGGGSAYPNIYSTKDGGENWVSQRSPVGHRLHCVATIDANNVLAVGDGGTILKTSNSGTEWTKVNSQVNTSFRGIYFINKDNGWIVGGYQILKSNDGGTTWDFQRNYEFGENITSVYFINQYIGWACGGLSEGLGKGLILKTTDGGMNWKRMVIAEESNSEGIHFSSIKFINDKVGWVVGSKSIYKSTDGGETWLAQIANPIPESLFSIDLLNENEGIIVGNNESILKTVNGGGTISGVDVLNDLINPDYQLSQNYPNPFNPTTTISFSIPKSQYVTLKVYDILGREVSTLVNEEKQPGNYNVQFEGSNLSSGVYYYQIRAVPTNGEKFFFQTKKMILLR